MPSLTNLCVLGDCSNMAVRARPALFSTNYAMYICKDFKLE